MSEELENYVTEVTAPLDPIFSEPQQTNVAVKNFDLSSSGNIIVELMEEQNVLPWSPKIPEHSDGDQHLNVGLDFFSATRMESEPIQMESNHKPTHKKTNENYHYAIIRTGVKIELPYGFHMMIGSRSGLGFKKHIQAFPGIIDHSYRGEIMIKLYGPEPFSIDVNDKIAQGIIFRSQNYTIQEGKVSNDTSRGENGFGSTG